MALYDILALIWFLAAWRIYAWVTDNSPWRKYTLSYAMHEERRRWMLAMSRRTVRILDGNIIAGLQHSTSFFASTSLLAIGAGFGLMTAADTLLSALEASTLHIQIERSAFFMKVVVLMLLYAYAFFKFGWAYRLFNYCAVMIAATPEAHEPQHEAKALAAAEMNISASKQFNFGLRSFFMAIPIMVWLLGAIPFFIATTLVLGALFHRQFLSAPRRVAFEAIFDPDTPDGSPE